MRGISSGRSSTFIVPSWQLLIRFKQARHCLLGLLASFRGTEGIASVTQPLPGQIPRAPLIPLASAGLLLPSIVRACDRYPLTWAAHLQSCSSALCEPSKLAPHPAPGSNNAASSVCPPSSSQHAHFQFHLEWHPHRLQSLRVLSLPSGHFLLPELTTGVSDVVRSLSIYPESFS